MHTPVLLKEAISALKIKKNGLYIDATVGEGGHFLEILKLGGRVLGIDLDKDQIQNLKLKISNHGNAKLVNGNYSNIEKIAKENNFLNVDGIIFDLGLSMRQLNESKRGFSYKNLDQDLDLRLDTTNKEKSAADLVKSLNAAEIYEILASYSEELNSRPISEAIVRSRRLKDIKTVGDLISVIDKVIGKKDKHIYARVFQALRIAVNNEFDNLLKGLEGSLKILKSSGRIVVITFHSLEDRLVKRFIKIKKVKQVNKKTIKGDRLFKFSRTAKLRVISLQ